MIARFVRLFADDPAFAALILGCAAAAAAALHLGVERWISGPLLALLLALAFTLVLRRDAVVRRREHAPRSTKNRPVG